MAKGFIDELTQTLTLDQPDMYVVNVARKRLAEWKRYYEEMHNDEGSDLWSEPFFVAVYEEYKRIHRLLKSRKFLEPQKTTFLEG